MFYTSRPYDEQEPLFKDFNQCMEYRKTADFFIKTKGLHSYFERNGGSLEKVIANAKRSMEEKQKDGRDYWKANGKAERVEIIKKLLDITELY